VNECKPLGGGGGGGGGAVEGTDDGLFNALLEALELMRQNLADEICAKRGKVIPAGAYTRPLLSST
jgi:hypothetical protein